MNEEKSEERANNRDEDRPSNRRQKRYFNPPVPYERRKPTMNTAGKENLTDCQMAIYWG
jgi:hypothetical protein